MELSLLGESLLPSPYLDLYTFAQDSYVLYSLFSEVQRPLSLQAPVSGWLSLNLSVTATSSETLSVPLTLV